MRFLLVFCSWPYYLKHTQQQSFVTYAPRDEQGRYLESYSRHITYYRATVASFITVITMFGLGVVGAVFAGLILFKPAPALAAVTCNAPGVAMNLPTTTTYCNSGDTFDITGWWYGTGLCFNTHFIYWQSNGADMLDSGSGLTVYLNPEGEFAEYVEVGDTVTCQTTGKYSIRIRTEGNKYSIAKLVYVDPPTAPSNLAETSVTTTSIATSWTDNSNNEELFRVQRQADITPTTDCSTLVNLTTTSADVATYTNSSLTANTGYCYQVRAENGNGNTDYTSAVKVYTLPVAPNISADRATSTWYTTPDFTFSNNAGWGSGGVRYYRYVWDTSPTHTWTDSESTWGQTESDCAPFNGSGGSCTSAGNTLALAASSDSNSLYLHVRSYNYAGANNGSQDIGPYYVDQVAPNSPAPVWDGAGPTEISWTNQVQGYAGSWTAADDDLSGFSKYQYAIGTTSGGSDTISWTDDGAITNIDNVDVALQNGQTYYLSVRAVDVAGNIGAVATSNGITVDTQAAIPTGIIDQPSLTSATISWTTNEPATTQLEWGATGAYGNLTSESAELTTDHSVTLAGLNENTTYYYRIRGTDRADNGTIGDGKTFITTQLEATLITNTASEVLSTTSTRITWTTNHAATSRVRYGLTTAYGSEVYSDTPTINHSLTLTGLTPGTTYHYEVLSVGNTSTNDADATFATLENTTVTGVSVGEITNSSAAIAWTTNHAATSQVRYGLTTAYGLEVTSGTLTTSHSLTLTGLTAGTTYHFEVSSVGNTTATNSDASFSTNQLEATAITNIAGEVLGTTSARITWTTNHAATSTTQYGTTTAYGSESANSELVTSHGQTLTGLQANTTYHYRVVSTGNSTAISSDQTFSTEAEPTPVPAPEPEPTPIPGPITAVTPTLITPTANWSSIQTKPTIIGLAKSGQTVLVYIDDVLNGRTKATTHASGTGSFAYAPASDLKVGWHTIYLKAEDSSGNISAPSSPISFRVEQPYVAPYVFQPEVSHTALPVIVLRGLAMNNSIIRVLIDGREVDEFTVQNNSSGTANFSYELSTDGQLAIGQHTVTLVAEDQNGRLSQATAPITFTKVAPSAGTQKNSSVQFGEKVVYTVQSGDSLWKIANKLLGDGSRYGEIVALNLGTYPQLHDSPGFILPGWKLILPNAR
ncbi:MAG: fibronectin type III domain-containing protein [Patescibacteria group bacterium]